jgi:hypothetical protein
MSKCNKPYAYSKPNGGTSRNITRNGHYVLSMTLSENDVSAVVDLLNDSYSLGNSSGRLEAYTECTNFLRTEVNKM